MKIDIAILYGSKEYICLETEYSWLIHVCIYRWDSFPLFLILNDYLRTDDNLKNGKFHEHLRQTFAPQVIRYVDLMESSIGQSIHKGFEKERWEIKG